MGCSSSKKAPPPGPSPAGRRTHGLRSRSLSSVLSSLGMCRGRNGGGDGVLHAYAKLPSAGDAAAAKWSPAVAEAAALPGAVVATSSSWPAAPSPLRPVRADLDYLPGLRQIVEDYYPLSSSHPSLLYPEHDHPLPPPPLPETTVVETTFDDVAVVDMGTPAARDVPEVVVTTGIVRARVDEFHEQMQKKNKDKKSTTTTAAAAAANDNDDVEEGVVDSSSTPSRAVVVLYFTSLRGVRRTFEDGRAARSILRCYGVRVDERDVSMHAAFKADLLLLLGGGGGPHAGPTTLPRAFVVVVDGGGGLRYCDLGGAEELREMHEAGELARALAGCEPGGGRMCAACGDARFKVCDGCHGSCKVLVADEGCRLAAGCFFQQCPDCNENGLVRCPVCCY
ncbi:hypothetical protein PR202_gb28691 [Eleusine coracana subsp. coracana]|uniref:Glutaredoxin domain-containing protein n=1 Tax=Eleusine coracana subsp. coracana TaxID=191504 RepID=A0AAV5FX15_ELECO|nr:hypothetical protein QOZ80_8BG0646380 [Eleusine coracana subsp. coracana]GJN39566.1 hypothetical protein PR202_gb28691 [Eleusine coracana subsp. coracana]